MKSMFAVNSHKMFLIEIVQLNILLSGLIAVKELKNILYEASFTFFSQMLYYEFSLVIFFNVFKCYMLVFFPFLFPSFFLSTTSSSYNAISAAMRKNPTSQFDYLILLKLVLTVSVTTIFI